MAEVELRNVRKSYGTVDVLHGLDLEIKSGELTVLLGPSGCGKSTLLRMIAGLEDITGGEIRIGGTTVNELSPGRRGCAMVFQNYALYPHKTVRKNIAFPLLMEGASKDRIAQRVAEVAETLQIQELLDRLPRDLSGGQRQRVAMGRAMVRNPSVFLFDEPLSNLDAELRMRMRLEIATLQRKIGATMIFVTHDQVEAMTLADRVVVMRAGHIEQVDTPLEVYRKPANRFVAGFLGMPAMNIVPFAGLGRKLAPIVDAMAPESIGIRPEHVTLARDEAGGILIEPNAYDIIGVEHLGDRSYLHLSLEQGEFTVLYPSGAEPPAANEPIRLQHEPEAIHLFDAQGHSLTMAGHAG